MLPVNEPSAAVVNVTGSAAPSNLIVTSVPSIAVKYIPETVAVELGAPATGAIVMVEVAFTVNDAVAEYSSTPSSDAVIVYAVVVFLAIVGTMN